MSFPDEPTGALRWKSEQARCKKKAALSCAGGAKSEAAEELETAVEVEVDVEWNLLNHLELKLELKLRRKRALELQWRRSRVGVEAASELKSRVASSPWNWT